jgi:hypothetical protein
MDCLAHRRAQGGGARSTFHFAHFRGLCSSMSKAIFSHNSLFLKFLSPMKLDFAQLRMDVSVKSLT